MFQFGLVLVEHPPPRSYQAHPTSFQNIDAMALARTQDVILLFGDSITEFAWCNDGLAQQLASAYACKFDVINRGLGGYQTDWAIPVFEQILGKRDEQQHAPKVQLLTIWFGANDAASLPIALYVPRDRYKANLTHLVNMIKSPTSEYHSPDTRIILITPPPVNTYQWQSGRSFEAVKSYAEAVKEVGEQLQVPVADVWTEMWESAGRDEKACGRFLYDGLHLNGAGYEIVFHSVMKIVKEKYPEIHPDKLQRVLPLWSDMSVDNHRSSLFKRLAKL